MTGPCPPAEESISRLHSAGWSVGEVGAIECGVLVTGTNGENALSATGCTADQAWHRACQQAAAVGMLPPEREG